MVAREASTTALDSSELIPVFPLTCLPVPRLPRLPSSCSFQLSHSRKREYKFSLGIRVCLEALQLREMRFSTVCGSFCHSFCALRRKCRNGSSGNKPSLVMVDSSPSVLEHLTFFIQSHAGVHSLFLQQARHSQHRWHF